MSSEAIFTQEDINNFALDANKYNLTMMQLKPVVLKHVSDKERFDIKPKNINKTIETVLSINDMQSLFSYMRNKLKKYEAAKDE